MEMITHHVDGRCPPRVAMASECFPASLRVRLRRDTVAFDWSGVVIFVLLLFFLFRFEYVILS